MSKDTVQEYYHCFNEKNWSGMLELLTDDVVHDISQGPSQKGKKAFQEFLKVMDKHYDENLRNMVLMSDKSGERVAAEFICDGKYKVTAEGLPPAKGQKYSIPVGAFFELKNGKIRRISNHYNLNDWIKQVGG